MSKRCERCHHNREKEDFCEVSVGRANTVCFRCELFEYNQIHQIACNLLREQQLGGYPRQYIPTKYLKLKSRLDRFLASREHRWTPRRIKRKVKVPVEFLYQEETDAEGYVYFVLNPSTRRIKIGYTVSVEHRLSTLQTGSSEPLALVAFIAGTMKDEKKLHKEFNQFRAQGEWFVFADEIKTYIKQMVNSDLAFQLEGNEIPKLLQLQDVTEIMKI